MQVWIFEIADSNCDRYQIWGVYASFNDGMLGVNEYFTLNAKEADGGFPNLAVSFTKYKELNDHHEWREQITHYGEHGWEVQDHNYLILRRVDVIGKPAEAS